MLVGGGKLVSGIDLPEVLWLHLSELPGSLGLLFEVCHRLF